MFTVHAHGILKLTTKGYICSAGLVLRYVLDSYWFYKGIYSLIEQIHIQQRVVV